MRAHEMRAHVGATGRSPAARNDAVHAIWATLFRTSVIAGMTAMASVLVIAPVVGSRDETVFPEVLALARQLADERAVKWHLYADELSRRLSPEWIDNDGWIVGYTAWYLNEGNPGRENDVLRFIDESFRPLILAKRDDFVCRTARRTYDRLIRAIDDSVRDGGGDREDKLSNPGPYRHSFLVGTPRTLEIDWYHFLWLSWDEVTERGFRLYALDGAKLDRERVLSPAALQRLDDEWFGATPCGEPWSVNGRAH